MVRIPGFHSCGTRSIPGQGTEIPHAVWRGQKRKKKNKQTKKIYCYLPYAWLVGDAKNTDKHLASGPDPGAT